MQQLLAQFPRQKKRIAEAALLDINLRELHLLIRQKRMWVRIKRLKRKYEQLQKTGRNSSLKCSWGHLRNSG